VAKLLADENFPFPVTQELRSLGHDVLTLEELGKADQGLSDEEVLALAAGRDRALLTINRRHFVRLHDDNRQHSGIIVCSIDIDFVGQARRISAALEPDESVAGKLFRINRPG
jgi:Domain of unknown function (DUF5615)